MRLIKITDGTLLSAYKIFLEGGTVDFSRPHPQNTVSGFKLGSLSRPSARRPTRVALVPVSAEWQSWKRYQGRQETFSIAIVRPSPSRPPQWIYPHSAAETAVVSGSGRGGTGSRIPIAQLGYQPVGNGVAPKKQERQITSGDLPVARGKVGGETDPGNVDGLEAELPGGRIGP